MFYLILCSLLSALSRLLYYAARYTLAGYSAETYLVLVALTQMICKAMILLFDWTLKSRWRRHAYRRTRRHGRVVDILVPAEIAAQCT
jgi:hypothetical protein